MISSGDWIVPHLNGLRYFEKPVLGYWVHAGAQLLFGQNNFAVRFPSALSVGLSAFLIFLLMYRMYEVDENENKGWASILAAMVFLTCLEVFGVGTTAVLDNLFSFFVTATIISFYFATETKPRSVKENWFLIVSGLFCGLAFMTKGFLAFAIPVVALVPYLIWERRYRDLWRLSWKPILVAILISLPWAIAVQLKEPDFWKFFFWNEHIRRFMADNAQHKESFWFFFMTAPGMFMPWIVLSPAAVAGFRNKLKDKNEQGRLLRFALCWLVVPFLFLSLSKGKLLTYILPCFPPFAILMSVGLLSYLKNNTSNRMFNWGTLINAIFLGILLVLFLVVQITGIGGFCPYLSGEAWKVIMAINALIVTIIFFVWAFRSNSVINKIVLFGLAPCFIFLIVHLIMPEQVVINSSPTVFLGKHKNSISKDTIIISDETTIRAVCWSFKRDDVYMLDYKQDELSYGLSYEDASVRSLDVRGIANMVRKNGGKVVFIASAKTVRTWHDKLPEPLKGYETGPDGYVFWQY